MQGKTISLKQIKVEQMSKETNISIDEIKKAFEGNPANNKQTAGSRKTTPLFKIPFTQEKSDAEIRKEDEEEEQRRKEDIEKDLKNMTTACDIYDYMRGNGLSESEKIPFYEKLILLISKELPNTNDFDDLVELWKHSPYGSLEEKLVREKINTVLTAYLAGENDIDTLTEKFEELPESLDEIEGKQILRRAITLCSTSDECDTVEEHLTQNGSAEDRLLDLRRTQIEVEEIQNTTDIDELKELYENADSASENERRIVEKLISQYNDFESLKDDLADYFADGTYGHFLTIKKMLTLVTTLEEAKEVTDECLDSTEELYQANKMFNEIFQQELAKATVERLDEILELIESGTLEYDQVLEKKANLLTDIDDLEEFINDSSEESVEYDVASEKINQYHKQLIEDSSAFDRTLELIEDTIPSDGPLFDLAITKLHSQATSEEEHEAVLGKAISSSYVEYLSAQALVTLRGGIEKKEEPTVIAQPVSKPTINHDEEERVRLETEYRDTCDKAKRDINRAYTPEQARAVYNICPDGSDEQLLAVEKIKSLVQDILVKNPSPYKLGQLYSVTIPDTETRFEVIKHMAIPYKKNWLGF